MVCHHRDMSGHDDIPRGSGWVVRGNVHITVDWESLGMDRGGKSRDTRTATPTKSSSVSRSVIDLSVHLDPVRHGYAQLLRSNRSTTSTSEHDGHVRFRIRSIGCDIALHICSLYDITLRGSCDQAADYGPVARAKGGTSARKRKSKSSRGVYRCREHIGGRHYFCRRRTGNFGRGCSRLGRQRSFCVLPRPCNRYASLLSIVQKGSHYLPTDFFKLTLYLTFFCVLCMFYGMPIHIIRDVAMTIKSFYKRITDFIKYRHATKDMNDRYPDATAEEIEREDTCIICREPMRPWGATTGQNDETASGRTQPEGQANNSDERLRPKKLPCNHILHFACLRSWLERQQNCPTCRQPVLVPASVVRNPPQPQMDREIGLQAGAPAHAMPAPGGNQPPLAAQNRIRFFDLGPIRFGFGAGRDINGLAEQFNDPAGPNHQREPPDNGAVRTFGFGLRLNRQPAATQSLNSAQFSPNATQTQLLTIEQQLMREINGIQAQMDQLHLVRALQGELARLRIAQANNNATVHANSLNSNHLANQSSSPQPSAVVPFNLPTIPAFRTFSNNHQRPGLHNGHPDLPAGLILPEGWTLTPLHRLPSHTGNGVGVSASQNGPNTEGVGNDHPPAPQLTSVPSSDPGPSSSQYRPVPRPSSANTESNQGGEMQGTAHMRSDHAPALSNTRPSVDNPETREQRPRPSPSVSDPRLRESSTTDRTSETIPQWGTNSQKRETTDSMSSGVEMTDEQTTSSAERRAAKGKGRATTVEDFDDSVD